MSTILNNISGIYSTELGEAKSITAEEINRLVGGITIDYENKTVYSNVDKTSYWLASLAVCCVDSDWAHFGPGTVIEGCLGTATGMSLANGNYFGIGSLFASFGDWNATGFSVRPVIYLNSEVTGEELHVINGQEDKEDWTSYLDVIGGDPMIASGNSSNGEAGNYGTSSGGETGPNL